MSELAAVERTYPRTIEALYAQPWEALQGAAWAARRAHHPDRLAFAVPGAKRYATECYANDPRRFASISVTGGACALQCDHCRGQLLAGMHPAASPEALLSLGEALIDTGCEGVLLSGGADADGAVPLRPFLGAIARLRARGLRVIVHTGLLDRETAQGLKGAGVDQVLFDVVGDAETIHDVLHLDRAPEDYAATLGLLRELDLPVAPHVVIGLHYGQLRGELRALEMVRQVGADVIVLVVLRPLRHTPMEGLPGVDPETVGRLAAVARLGNPRTPLALGCARPPGEAKFAIERYAVLAGVNVVAYPDPATVRLAGELGLRTSFAERCCTLALGPS
ncbi:MAG: radical SAM protein [Anaerolineae bacterium]|nr:radical SAM protein [Anaerolineae bacterium]